MLNHSKRLIVDFDDTLAFTENRDWKNAKPNNPLIKHLNLLQSSGWIVDIYTARGSISCPTREEADKKYRKSIETWLENNKVLYNNLSFDKPLGAYYIDDKGITPQDFLNTKIKSLNGFSGADIYTDGFTVHKTQDNAHEVVKWYTTVNKSMNVPAVYRVVGNTISMEHIEFDKDYFQYNTLVGLAKIQETLKILKKFPSPNRGTFKDYTARVHTHAKNCSSKVISSLLAELETLEVIPTFSHGDFSVSNILFKDEEVYLIDPIPQVYGSIELDVAKFCASLYFSGFNSSTIKTCENVLSCYNNIPMRKLHLLICSELLRVHTYHPNKSFIVNIIENVFTKER